MDLGLRRWANRLISWWDRRRGPDDKGFLEAAYHDLLGRPADPASQTQALESLARGDLTRAAIRTMLLNSPERQAYESTRQVYQELLDREPTADERWQGIESLQAGGSPDALRQTVSDTIEYFFRHTPVAPDEEPYHTTHLPYEVWLEPTTRCNMVPPCTMCGKSASASRKSEHDMDPQIWQDLLPVLSQARILGLHGGGEPLFYPHLFDLLEEIDPQQTEVGFNTNGHLLTEKTTRRLIEHQLAWLSVSIDAATPEMYLRLRRRKDWDRLLARIRRLLELREQMGSKRPRVELNMTVMRTNLPQAPRLVELAAELGVDSVLFQQILPGGRWSLETPDGYLFDYAQEEISQCVELHDEMIAQAGARARELGIPLGYEIAYQGEVEDLAGESVPVVASSKGTPAASTSLSDPDNTSCNRCTCNIPPEFRCWPPTAMCDEPWTKALISVDGDVTFCCYHIPDVVLGNVRETPFEEIWNSPRARTVRALLMGEDVPRCCRDCYLFYEG